MQRLEVAIRWKETDEAEVERKKISAEPSCCFTAQRVDEIKTLADYLTHQAAGGKIETVSPSSFYISTES